MFTVKQIVGDDEYLREAEYVRFRKSGGLYGAFVDLYTGQRPCEEPDHSFHQGEVFVMSGGKTVAAYFLDRINGRS